MKTVTEEFQKQMNSLINKLIQENFDQLNKSVEKLNTWQQENKAMISSLTQQYKEMASNFESTSTTLSQVGDDTRTLVSEGGKLKQLIDSLNQVIVEDQNSLMFPTNSKKQQTYQKKIWRNLMNQRKFLMIGFVNNVILWMASNFSLRN